MKFIFKIILATTIIIAPTKTYENISEDINELSELPLNELLSQKKFLLDGNLSLDSELIPSALPLVGENPGRINPLEHMQVKGLHRLPIKRGHYEEEEEEWVPKGKDKEKINKIFNTSIMALSFLAFGGYVLCLIVNAIKEKNMEMMATPAPASQQILLQQLYNSNKPYPPYPLRLPTGNIPAFTISGKRKKRSNTNPFRYYEVNNTNPEDKAVIVEKLLDSLQFFSEDIVDVYNFQVNR